VSHTSVKAFWLKREKRPGPRPATEALFDHKLDTKAESESEESEMRGFPANKYDTNYVKESKLRLKRSFCVHVEHVMD